MAIWPTPLLKINKDNFIPSEIIDIFSFDERFVSNEDTNAINDLKALIDKTHELGLQFIADIPLTVFNDTSKTWVKNIPSAILRRLNNLSKIILNLNLCLENGNSVALNLNNEEVRSKLAIAAAQFLKLGVDALHLTDYGLLQKMEQYNSKEIKALINKIYAEIANDSSIVQKNP